MAVSQWKLTRMEIVEVNIFEDAEAAKNQLPMLDRLWQAECRLERSYARAQRELERLQNSRPQPDPQPTAEPPAAAAAVVGPAVSPVSSTPKIGAVIAALSPRVEPTSLSEIRDPKSAIIGSYEVPGLNQ
jgi:hypothetical protein